MHHNPILSLLWLPVAVDIQSLCVTPGPSPYLKPFLTMRTPWVTEGWFAWNAVSLATQLWMHLQAPSRPWVTCLQPATLAATPADLRKRLSSLSSGS